MQLGDRRRCADVLERTSLRGDFDQPPIALAVPEYPSGATPSFDPSLDQCSCRDHHGTVAGRLPGADPLGGQGTRARPGMSARAALRRVSRSGGEVSGSDESPLKGSLDGTNAVVRVSMPQRRRPGLPREARSLFPGGPGRRRRRSRLSCRSTARRPLGGSRSRQGVRAAAGSRAGAPNADPTPPCAVRLAAMGLQTIRRGTDPLGSPTTADGDGFLAFLGELPDTLWGPGALD